MSDSGAKIVRLPPRDNQVAQFRPFFAAEMQGRVAKPRDWLIDGVLLRRSVMLFSGPPKIGKGLLLQHLLTATSMGSPWLDRETVPERSFGIFAEDPQEELERRQEDLNAFYNRDPADYETQFSWLSLDGKPGLLVEFDRFGNKPRFTTLWNQLWNYVAEEEIRVVGLDNARVLFGGSELNPNQVTAFVRELVRKAIEIDGAVILAAHPAKNDPRGYAGSGAWLASVRAGMSLQRPQDWDEERDTMRDPRRMLRGLGANYGAGIGAEPLEIRDGVFVPQDQDSRPARRAPQGPLSDQAMLDLRYRLAIGLKRVILNGALVPADEFDSKSMAYRARRSGDNEINQISLNELNRAQRLMLDAGQIVRVTVGKKTLIRTADGPYYVDEEPWLPITVPPKATDDMGNAAE